MNKKESFKLIDENYYKIKEVLENVSFSGYHYQYFNLIKDEEKKHRTWKPEGVTCGLSVNEATKLFYVTDIIEAVLSPKYNFTIKDYISIRQSVLLAYSLAENYKKELSEALQGVNVDEISKIDYAELMK